VKSFDPSPQAESMARTAVPMASPRTLSIRMNELRNAIDPTGA
jgi:hypothetical protein